MSDATIPVELLKDLEVMEEEGGERRGGSPVSKGVHEMVLSTDDSEVVAEGLPALQLAFEVTSGVSPREGGDLGRKVFRRLFWFAAEESNSDKPAEERERITREIGGRFLLDHVYQMAGNPDADIKNIVNLKEAIKALKEATDPNEVEALMEAVLEYLSDTTFYQRVWHSKGTGENEGEVYANFSPYLYKRGKAPVAELTAKSFAEGQGKAGAIRSTVPL